MSSDAPHAARTRPLTGAEYLESIRDGREIWIYGERVKDVTTHPAFRNTARMIARFYDAMHDPARKAVLTTETDTGSGGFTHRYYKASRTADDLVAARDAIAEGGYEDAFNRPTAIQSEQQFRSAIGRDGPPDDFRSTL